MVENFCPPNTLKVLVGNKTDLFEERSVSSEKAKKFMDDYELDMWFEVSAKSPSALLLTSNPFMRSASSSRNQSRSDEPQKHSEAITAHPAVTSSY